jgi:putative addiction module component (TIGR02574 family)
MTEQSDTILNNALKLPLQLRAYVAERLIESLDEEGDLSVSPAWQEEINRRRLEVENGTVSLIAAEEVFDKAFRSIE